MVLPGKGTHRLILGAVDHDGVYQQPGGPCPAEPEENVTQKLAVAPFGQQLCTAKSFAPPSGGNESIDSQGNLPWERRAPSETLLS